jgi:hypothetical protein
LTNIYLVSDPVEYFVPVQPGSAPQENTGFGGTTETLTLYLVSDPVEYSVPVQPGSAPQENIGFGGTTDRTDQHQRNNRTIVDRKFN